MPSEPYTWKAEENDTYSLELGFFRLKVRPTSPLGGEARWYCEVTWRDFGRILPVVLSRCQIAIYSGSPELETAQVHAEAMLEKFLTKPLAQLREYQKSKQQEDNATIYDKIHEGWCDS
jgi:hypothetical protein